MNVLRGENRFGFRGQLTLDFPYGNHVEDKREMADPAVKENLTTDREYWRRVYAGQAMQGIFAGRNWRSGEMIPDCIGFARNAVELADALIEELEKTEK